MRNEKTRLRSLLLTLLAPVLFAGCDGGPEDFIDLKGTYLDVTAMQSVHFHFHEHAIRMVCNGQKKPDCHTLAARNLTAGPTEWFRGVRIDFVPKNMTARMPYQSSVGPIDPVAVYIIRATSTGYVDSAIESDQGQVVFASFGTNPGDTTAGTASGLVLIHTNEMTGEDQTLMKVDQGSFQYQQP